MKPPDAVPEQTLEQRNRTHKTPYYFAIDSLSYRIILPLVDLYKSTHLLQRKVNISHDKTTFARAPFQFKRNSKPILKVKPSRMPQAS